MQDFEFNSYINPQMSLVILIAVELLCLLQKHNYGLTWMHLLAVFSVSTTMASMYLPSTFVMATLQRLCVGWHMLIMRSYCGGQMRITHVTKKVHQSRKYKIVFALRVRFLIRQPDGNGTVRSTVQIISFYGKISSFVPRAQFTSVRVRFAPRVLIIMISQHFDILKSF